GTGRWHGIGARDGSGRTPWRFSPGEDSMAQPDGRTPSETLPGLRGKLALARLSLAWESLWPAIWPAVAVAGLFLAFALLDVFPALPIWLHALLLAAFVVAFGLGLVRAVRDFIWPALGAGRRRLELASGLDHRPLSAVNDTL